MYPIPHTRIRIGKIHRCRTRYNRHRIGRKYRRQIFIQRRQHKPGIRRHHNRITPRIHHRQCEIPAHRPCRHRSRPRPHQRNRVRNRPRLNHQLIGRCIRLARPRRRPAHRGGHIIRATCQRRTHCKRPARTINHQPIIHIIRHTIQYHR